MGNNAASGTSTPSTEAVLRNHLRAAKVGVDALLADYTEQSVMITQDATYRGIAEIRRFFTALLEDLPPGFFDRMMKISREEIVGEVGYLLWNGEPIVSQATDTFLVRDGKILLQTFTAARRTR